VTDPAESGPEWDWAAPIPEEFIVRRGELHCRTHGRLYSVGEIELWELALDARKHWLEHHG